MPDYPLTSNDRRVQYIASENQTVFDYPYPLLAAGDVRVTVQTGALPPTLLDVGVGDYTLTGVGSESGGTVVLAAGAGAGDRVTLTGARPATRLVDYQEHGSLRAAALNADLDALTVVVQELQRDAALAVRVDAGDADADTRLPVQAARAGKLLAFDADGAPVAVADVDDLDQMMAAWRLGALGSGPGADGFVTADMLADSDDALDAIVGKLKYRSLPGAPAIMLKTRLGWELDLALDFGAPRDGTGNATSAMQSFLDAAVETGNRAFIGAGTYAVDEGVVVLNSGWVDRPFPAVETAGHHNVTLRGRGTGAGAFLTITNGAVTSTSGRYWRGGGIGGLKFIDVTGDVAPDRHGVKMTGTWQQNHGYWVGQGLRGHLLHIPQQLFGGNNPDPYAVNFAVWEGLEANFVEGRCLDNQNFVGFDGCRVKVVRAIGTGGGVVHGLGAGNYIDIMSAGSCAGWALDDGCFAGAPGGSSSRCYIGLAELDDCEYGIRLNRAALMKFQGIRFVHRKSFNDRNTSGLYWPRVAIDIAGAADVNVSDIDIEVWHRIEAGGSKAQVGKFVDCHNSGGIANVTIDQRVSDNAPHGYVDRDLYSGVGPNTQMVIAKQGRIIADTRPKMAVTVAGALGQNIGSGTIGAPAGAVHFLSERSDIYDAHNPVTGFITLPFDATCDFDGRLMIPLPVGARLRMAVVQYRPSTGSYGVVATAYYYSSDADPASYAIQGSASFLAEDQIFLTVDQSSGTAVEVTALIADIADNYFTVRAR